MIGGDCCDCKKRPIVCGGTTRCAVVFGAGEREACVWVKIDGDNKFTPDKVVTLGITRGEHKATLKIIDQTDGESNLIVSFIVSSLDSCESCINRQTEFN